MRKVGIGLLGLGTVGSGVFKILDRHHSDFSRKVGADLELRAVLEKDASKAKAVGVNEKLIVKSIEDILEDPSIDVVIEVIGGTEPAKEFILRAIDKGKHVVTANKVLMATCGKEILGAAEAKGVDIFFEASVGGGIPIVRPLKECLAGNKINRVMGIVNGTTNFVLTKMSEEKCSFEIALREAQARGYAEKDPSADIEGHDAAAKIAILASIAFNSRVTAGDVYTEGIGQVTLEDIAYAKESGNIIKLVALAKEEDGELEVRVHPTMIPKNHPLAAVREVYNAIFVEGDAVGEVMFFGPGAGGMPAASAVVGDVIEIARNLQFGRSGRISCTCYEEKRIRPISEVETSYYLRMDVVDRPGVLAQIARVFGDNEVSLASVIQRGPRGANAELVFITHLVQEKNIQLALTEVNKLKVVNKVCNLIRVEARGDD